MKRKVLRFLMVLGLAGFLIVAPVLAAYSATIQVTESNNTSYAQLPIVISVDHDYLVANGYITATGLDTRVEAGGVVIPHLVVDDKLLFSSAVSANTTANFVYTTGNTALTAFNILSGDGGYITVTDDATLELGDIFELEIEGWVNTGAGSVSDNVTTKADAFNITISGVGSITADIIGGASVTASSVTSGEHTILVVADGTTLKIHIDNVEEGSVALGGVGVPDNASNWLLPPNDVMPYVVSLWVNNRW